MNERKNSALGKVLNRYFQFYERGSDMRQEVKAGISVFLISVCALFFNIQIITKAFSDDIPYCGIYLGATIAAFLGTLIVGLLCNLPLVQTASLSMSTVFISMLGTGTGLTYANMLAVAFVAGVVYLAAMAVPVVRSFLFQLIPDSVRKALPVTLGLYIAYTSLKNMQLIGSDGIASIGTSALGGASVAPYIHLCIGAGIVGFILTMILRKREAETPALTGLIVTTLLFYLVAAVSGGIVFSSVFNQNRIWVGVNPDPLGEMYTIMGAIKELPIGSVFSKGFDFSAYQAAGGNVILLFVQGILAFVFMGMYESEAALQGADQNDSILEEGSYEKQSGKMLLANAIASVIAPLAGSAPISIGKQSAIAALDGAKTGLASVICAIGYLISMFTWLPFVIFATYTASVPEYGHAGFVFPNIIKAAFQSADAVMLVAGLLMLKKVKDMAEMSVTELLAFAMTIAVGVSTQNIAYGVAGGVIVYTILGIAAFQKKEINEKLQLPQYLMTLLSIVLLVITLTSGSAVQTAASTATGGDESASATEQSSDAQNTVDATKFTFDSTTGAYTFTANTGADYSCIWVYAVDDSGKEGSQYVAASERMSGDGDFSGNIDLTALSYGEYHAKLMTFMPGDETAPDPSVKDFSVTGKLTKPEFNFAQDGESVKVSLYDGVLTTYNDKEKFTNINVNVYDASGNVVKTEVITKDDLTKTLMGPFTKYTCEKTLTLEDGTYQISMTAAGDDKVAQASDESDRLSVTVAAGTTSAGMTTGYVVDTESTP